MKHAVTKPKKHGVAVSVHDTTGVLVVIVIVVVAAGVGSTTPVAGAAEGETGKGLGVPVVVIDRVGVQTPDPPNSTSALQQHPLPPQDSGSSQPQLNEQGSDLSHQRVQEVSSRWAMCGMGVDCMHSVYDFDSESCSSVS